MSVYVRSVPLDPIGLENPGDQYGKLCKMCDELKALPEKKWDGRCPKDIIIPTLLKAALLGTNFYFVFKASLSTEVIKTSIIRDLAQSMLSFLSETSEGRGFATALGYKNVTTISLDEFLANFSGAQGSGILGYCKKFSPLNFWYNENFVQSGFSYVQFGSVLATGISVMFVVVPCLGIKSSCLQLNENDERADRLISRIDDFTTNASGSLTNHEINTLRSKRWALWRAKNRPKIVTAVGISLIFMVNLSINLAFAVTARNAIVGELNPNKIYQPELDDFCWDSSCLLILPPQNTSSTHCSYPSSIVPYARNNSHIDDSSRDFAERKIGLISMVPLFSVYIIPTVITSIFDAIFKCCKKRSKNKDPFEDIEADY